MKMNSLSRALFFGALIAFGLFGSASAGLLIPNGNPTGPSVASGTGGSSYLNPTPASYRTAGDCPWVVPALEAEGYTAKNGWTINKVALEGNIELGTYVPWVNVEPPITQGAYTFAAEANNGNGGATIGLNYQPNPDDFSTDPQGNTAHWVQVVHTNQPSAFGTANGANGGGGFTNYIDNGYNSKNTLTPPSNPFYDSGYAANNTDFVDVPSRQLRSGADWQAQVFIAAWSPNDANNVTKGGTITLYDGVWWGFYLPAPEPSSMVLAASGGFFLLICVWRKRRKP